mmetsp:Transcript_52988/g.103650  ORF Transcript_52988/g.103650 Transcript_52988/m.103650 type:complete len:153 (-) Transcript_52988:867-1325(-)
MVASIAFFLSLSLSLCVHDRQPRQSHLVVSFPPPIHARCPSFYGFPSTHLSECLLFSTVSFGCSLLFSSRIWFVRTEGMHSPAVSLTAAARRAHKEGALTDQLLHVKRASATDTPGTYVAGHRGRERGQEGSQRQADTGRARNGEGRGGGLV